MTDLRRTLLKVMLGALGAAAIGGVLAVLTGASEVVARGAGTALWVGLGAAVAMPAAWMVERERTRVVGLYLLGWVLAQFSLGLLLIWGLDGVLGSDGAALAGLTMLWLAAWGLPAAALLMVRGWPGCRWGVDVGLAALAVAFALCEVGATVEVVGGRSWWRAERWFASGAAVGLFGLTASAALLGWGDRWSRPWRWVGVAASAVAAGMWIAGTWLGTTGGEDAFVTAVALAVVVAHANVLAAARLGGAARHLRTATVLAAAVAATMIVAVVVADLDVWGLDTWFGRLTGASLVLAACGTMAVGLVSWLTRRPVEGRRAERVATVAVTCPHCAKRLVLPVGQSECRFCRLRFVIRVEEPTCQACGYLLYGLRGNACPECGAAVGPAEPGVAGDEAGGAAVAAEGA